MPRTCITENIRDGTFGTLKNDFQHQQYCTQNKLWLFIGFSADNTACRSFGYVQKD